MGELIISGLMFTHNSPMTNTRNPFLSKARGITARVKMARRVKVRSNRCPAKRLVMNNTRLECTPLHSGATVKENPGNAKSIPVRTTGMPPKQKKA